MYTWRSSWRLWIFNQNWDGFQNNTCKILNNPYIKDPTFFTFHLINGLWPQRMMIMWVLCTEIIYHINYLNWFFRQNILFQVLWTSEGFPSRCFAHNLYFCRELLLIIERNSRLLLMIQQTPPVFIYIEIRLSINSKKTLNVSKTRHPTTETRLIALTVIDGPGKIFVGQWMLGTTCTARIEITTAQEAITSLQCYNGEVCHCRLVAEYRW